MGMLQNEAERLLNGSDALNSMRVDIKRITSLLLGYLNPDNFKRHSYRTIRIMENQREWVLVKGHNNLHFEWCLLRAAEGETSKTIYASWSGAQLPLAFVKPVHNDLSSLVVGMESSFPHLTEALKPFRDEAPIPGR